MRQTPRTASRSARTAAGALIAGAAMVAVALPANPASASPAQSAGTAATHAQPRAGALPATLSAAQHSALLQQAQAGATATAQSLRLGAKEKLVAKDVVKDQDGTVHTRYERTYDGLPVLGGDLVVATNAAGATTAVDKATNATLTVRTADRRAERRQGAVVRDHHRQGRGRGLPHRGRLPPQGGLGRQRRADPGVGVGDRRLPGRRHAQPAARHHRRHHRREALPVPGHRERRRQQRVQRPGEHHHHAVRLDVQPDRRHPRRPQARTTSTTARPAQGTLFTDTDDVWGDGNGTTAETAGVDAAYGAQETWDFYKNTFGRNGIANDGSGRLLPRPTTATTTSTPSGTTAASA